MRALPQMPLCGPWAVDRPGVRARAAGRRSRTASYSLRQTLGPRSLVPRRSPSLSARALTLRYAQRLPHGAGSDDIPYTERALMSDREIPYIERALMGNREMDLREV